VTYQSSSGDPKVIIVCPQISVEYCNIGGLSPGTSYIVTVTSKFSINAQRTSSNSITATTSKLHVMRNYICNFVCDEKYN